MADWRQAAEKECVCSKANVRWEGTACRVVAAETLPRLRRDFLRQVASVLGVAAVRVRDLQHDAAVVFEQVPELLVHGHAADPLPCHVHSIRSPCTDMQG